MAIIDPENHSTSLINMISAEIFYSVRNVVYRDLITDKPDDIVRREYREVAKDVMSKIREHISEYVTPEDFKKGLQKYVDKIGVIDEGIDSEGEAIQCYVSSLFEAGYDTPRW